MMPRAKIDQHPSHIEAPGQPPLPGAEAVRTIENPAPEFDAPFSLTPPENRTLDAAPRSLFELMEVPQ